MTAAGPPLADPAELAAELGPAHRRLLVLDFDGVLSSIVEHYDRAVPVDGAVEVLSALAEVTFVAVVSGRSIDDLRHRLGRAPVALAGSHGAQLELADGRRDDLVDPTGVAGVLDAVQEQVDALLGDTAGWLVERKYVSLAVHYRLADPATLDTLEPRIHALLDHAASEPPGFEVLDGKAVVELRPTGVDKGRALDRLADLQPARKPLVLGDDVTDEDAFKASDARSGAAVLVAETPRPTHAGYRLKDPAAVIAFLESLLERES